MTYADVENMTKNSLKGHMKIHARNVSFSELTGILKEHTKVKHIKYSEYKMQDYLFNSEMPNDEVNMMSALGSHCVRGVWYNFQKMYTQLSCLLKCDILNPKEDTQDHILKWGKLNHLSDESVKIEYGNPVEQKKVAWLFLRAIRKRKMMLETMESSLAGNVLDHIYIH